MKRLYQRRRQIRLVHERQEILPHSPDSKKWHRSGLEDRISPIPQLRWSDELRPSRLPRVFGPACRARPLSPISNQRPADARWFSTEIFFTEVAVRAFECTGLLDTSELYSRPPMLDWLARRHRVARFASSSSENPFIAMWLRSVAYLLKQIVSFPEDFWTCSSIAEEILIHFFAKSERQRWRCSSRRSELPNELLHGSRVDELWYGERVEHREQRFTTTNGAETALRKRRVRRSKCANCESLESWARNSWTT